MDQRPHRIWGRVAVLVLVLLLAAASGWAAAQGTSQEPALARWTLAGAAWSGTAPQVEGQGNIGPAGPAGLSQNSQTQVQLGFWAGAMVHSTPGPTGTPTPTPTVSPAQHRWLPLVIHR